MAIAKAIESMGDADSMLDGEDFDTLGEDTAKIATITDLRVAAARSATEPHTDDELLLATQLVRGHAMVEIPGRWGKGSDPPPVLLVIPEPRSLADYSLAPHKHMGIMLSRTSTPSKPTSSSQEWIWSSKPLCGHPHASAGRTQLTDLWPLFMR
jgi:hypothetical protein